MVFCWGEVYLGDMNKLLATVKNNLFLKILTVVNIGWFISIVVVALEFFKTGKGEGFEFLYVLQIAASIPFFLVYIMVSLLRIKRLDFYDKFFLIVSILGFVVTVILISIIMLML
jgi:hypothetical protein